MHYTSSENKRQIQKLKYCVYTIIIHTVIKKYSEVQWFEGEDDLCTHALILKYLAI